MTRSRAAWAGHVCLSLMLAALPTRSALGQSAPVPLTPGSPALQAQLAAGARDRYAVELRTGQLLKVEVEQRGIDVNLALRAPDGTVLVTDADGISGLLGSEELQWEATVNGPYVLEVGASPRLVNAGGYAVRVDVAEQAGPRDRAWIAAQRLFMDGRHRQQQSGEDSEAAIRNFEAALPKWREAADPKWEAATLLNLGVVRFRLQQPEAARDSYERALALERQMGDRRAEASTLSNLGNVYHRLT